MGRWNHPWENLGHLYHHGENLAHPDDPGSRDREKGVYEVYFIFLKTFAGLREWRDWPISLRGISGLGLILGGIAELADNGGMRD